MVGQPRNLLRKTLLVSMIAFNRNLGIGKFKKWHWSLKQGFWKLFWEIGNLLFHRNLTGIPGKMLNFRPHKKAQNGWKMPILIRGRERVKLGGNVQ